jgi:hypothetical protein
MGDVLRKIHGLTVGGKEAVSYLIDTDYESKHIISGFRALEGLFTHSETGGLNRGHRNRFQGQVYMEGGLLGEISGLVIRSPAWRWVRDCVALDHIGCVVAHEWQKNGGIRYRVG